MATTDGAGKIIIPRPTGKRRRHLRAIPVDGGLVWLLNIPVDEFYAGNDPCPNDPACVVIRINFQPMTQENAYETTLPQ